jgi:N-acetylglucosaminyldiphosphoundecaprenol N-acetyl-beta-D-mannosaminyltransferase
LPPEGGLQPARGLSPAQRPPAEKVNELYDRFSRGGIRRRRWARAFHSIAWFGLLGVLSGLKRAIDFFLALVLILILSPVLVVLVVRGLHKTPRVGRWCEPFDQFRGIPVLFNILKGDMAFVGPRAAAPGELNPREREARKRYSARPGLICLWFIRKRANIAYSAETASDTEYIESQTIRGDFGIALRAVPALLYGEGVHVTEDVISILGITIHNLTMTDALEWIMGRTKGSEPGQISFLNADCANLSYRDPDYKTVLNDSELVLADGIGLKLAGKLLRREIRQNVNGTDMFPRLCETLAGTGAGIYLLGARPGVAAKVAEWITERYPTAVVSGFRDGYFSEAEEPAVIEQIAKSGAAVLLVAFGAPRQDKWVRRHLHETGVKVAMGVGGLFDFYSGRIPRAPQWMREIGMEWFYRFMQEPRRMWRRYFVGNAVFLWRVMRARRGGKPAVAARGAA